MWYTLYFHGGVLIPLAKALALTPARFAAEGLDCRLRGNDVFGKAAGSKDSAPDVGRTYEAERRSALRCARKEFFLGSKPECY
jgi:hypothetical protein